MVINVMAQRILILIVAVEIDNSFMAKEIICAQDCQLEFPNLAGY